MSPPHNPPASRPQAFNKLPQLTWFSPTAGVVKRRPGQAHCIVKLAPAPAQRLPPPPRKGSPHPMSLAFLLRNSTVNQENGKQRGVKMEDEEPAAEEFEVDEQENDEDTEDEEMEDDGTEVEEPEDDESAVEEMDEDDTAVEETEDDEHGQVELVDEEMESSDEADDDLSDDSENNDRADGEPDDEGVDDGNDEADGESSEDEASGDENYDNDLHKAQAPWPETPSRKKILDLMQLWDPEEFTTDGWLPDPAPKEIASTAIASVEFLRSLGDEAIHPSKMGIDHAGRLFKVRDNSKKANFRKDFTDMVSKLEDKANRVRIKKEIEEAFVAYLPVEEAAGCIFHEESAKAVESLLRFVEAAVRKRTFKMRELEQAFAKCEKVAATLTGAISAITVVQQDLLDTGSTSLKRWNKFREIGISGERPGSVPPEDLNSYTEKLASYMESYQWCLGMTLYLKDRVDLALSRLQDCR